MLERLATATAPSYKLLSVITAVALLQHTCWIAQHRYLLRASSSTPDWHTLEHAVHKLMAASRAC
eukprot:16313-Heterococcus_DN1.PRE.2